MLKSALVEFFRDILNKFADYTKYVHLGVYASVWTLFILLFSIWKVPILIPLTLGGIVNLLIGILFWFLPALLVKRKSDSGKNWKPLLSIINIGLIRYLMVPLWIISLLVFIISSSYKSDSLCTMQISTEMPSLNHSKPFPQLRNEKTLKNLNKGKTHFEELQVAAEKGNPKAQTDVGLAYNRGEGVTQDHQEAFKWYTLAAEQGYARAQYDIGVSYARGEGVEQDYQEALRWYTLAADQGYAKAQYNIAHLYVNGKGVTQDYQEALRWYTLAAEQGYSWAQYNIAHLYVNGEGITQDYQEALKWYTFAAEQGDPDAQYSLANLYYDGNNGVPQDYQEALKWYTLAADQGHAWSQYCLGRIYLCSHGTKFDFNKGLMWNKLALDQGVEDAGFIIKEYETIAKPGQIKAIAKMVREWKRAHGK